MNYKAKTPTEDRDSPEAMRQLLRWRPSSGWQTMLVIGLIVAVFALAGLVLIVRVRGLTPATAALVTAVATLVGVLITQVAQAYLARSGHVQSLELESERAQDESLRKYLEQMGEWLTNEKLRGPGADPNTRVLARAQTLTLLRGVGSNRKRILLQFLYEARLIGGTKALFFIGNSSTGEEKVVSLDGEKIIDLEEADLSNANLSGLSMDLVDLYHANLREGNLEDARMASGKLGLTILTRANLRKAILNAADVNGAKLQGADLHKADLSLVRLHEADLNNANLSNADLTGANLTGAT